MGVRVSPTPRWTAPTMTTTVWKGALTALRARYGAAMATMSSEPPTRRRIGVGQEDQDEDGDEGGGDGGEHALAAGGVGGGEVAGAEGAGDEGEGADAHAEEEGEGEEHEEVGDAGGGQGFGAEAAGERGVDHEQGALHQVFEHGGPAEREEAAADLGEG